MENNEKSSNLHDKLIDLELAKNTSNSKARKLLPAVVLMATFYYSFLFSLGILLGYLGSKIYSKYFIESGKVDCIYVELTKNWKIHMHHWIMGILFLVIVWFIDYFYLPRFFVGMVIGIIAHDIYDYNDWHKVLVKNEKPK